MTLPLQMLSLHDAFLRSKQELSCIYDAHEAGAISHELLEYITGLGRLQRLSEKEALFTPEQQAGFEKALDRLLLGEPLQYITGIQWFLGRCFQVNKEVLIPRPETEELVQWIIDDYRSMSSLNVLDIGTGSGCIPVSLKLGLHNVTVTSCDISEGALAMAQVNATNLNAAVDFRLVDFLDEKNWSLFGSYQVIVSNPPYIPISEKEVLDKNVRDFEPATALFVPDNDPLLFYKKIAAFGKEHLNPGGAIYCELHQDYAFITCDMFHDIGYEQVELRKDIHENFRMLKAM